MNIGINTRFLIKDKMEGFGWYSYEICKRIVEKHPEHTFYFFFDRPYNKEFIFSENVVPIVCSPPARHPILFYIWFEFSIKRAIKKYKISLFFSPDGYLSLRVKIPQVITIHDLNFEHYPNDIPFFARIYLRFFFPKFARKANHIITVSNYSKNDITKTYKIQNEKISVIYNSCSDKFFAVDKQEKIKLKNSLGFDKPYFLYVGSLHPRKNILRLLESYELYTQKIENSFDLVLVGSFLWNSFQNKIKISDKLKTKIHFTGHLSIEKLVKITQAADAFIYIPYFEGFGIPLVEAMKCSLPIISGNLTSLPEVANKSAYYVNPFDIDEIVNAMEIFTLNENIRNQFSKMSIERAKDFSWDFSAQKTWEVIEKIIK